MPYDIHNKDNDPKYNIRFRGSAMIPRLGRMAPCRVELSYRAIETILESLYRRPMFLEVYYVDPNGREWEIRYNNYKKILPKLTPKTSEVKKEEKPMQTPVQPEPIVPPVEVVEEEKESVINEDDREMESINAEKLPDPIVETEIPEEDRNQQSYPYSNQQPYKGNNNQKNKHRH